MTSMVWINIQEYNMCTMAVRITYELKSSTVFKAYASFSRLGDRLKKKKIARKEINVNKTATQQTKEALLKLL